MPDLEISNLPALAEASVQATDPLAIADLSGSETKKITVKDLIAAGVALIDNGDIPGAKVGTLGTDQVASAAIQSGAVTNIKIETSTSSTTGIDGAAKIRAGSITVDRLDATKFDRGLSVASSKLGISNSISAGTTSGITYTAQGLISGVAALGATDLPKATASAIGAVSVPTAGKLAVDGNGAISLADVSGLSAGSYAKVTVNVKGQVTAGTTLSATDVPLATTSARGAIIVPSSGGLAVDGSGNISIATQGSVSAGSYAKVTVNTKGIITGTGSLADTDIPNHSAAKLTSGTLPDARIGASAITTTRLNNGAVTNDKVETSTSSSTGLDGASKLRDGTVTAAKLNTTNIDRSLNVASGKLGINNTISAATRSGISYNAQGLITATAALVAGDLPLATTSAVGGVSAGTGLTVSGAGALSLTNSVTGAQVSGITFNNQGMITAATGLVAGDLPVATTSAKGAVQITSGGGLTVDGNGNLSTSTSGISAGTYGKLTVNNKGVATAGAALAASDIPVLDANKITTGSIAAARIGNDTIDGTKLSNTSTAIFQSIAQSGYPTAQFNGQILFDTVSEDAFIWDGNAWQAITTLTKGSLVFGGTFNASTSKMASTTTAGIAAGLAVGSNLPSPSSTTDGVYVVVDVAGTPSAPAPVVSLSPPDYILGVTNSGGSSWNEIDLSQTVAGQVASNIVFTPYGQLSSTNVQDALQELETEKMGLAGGTCTGQLLISNTGSIVFEGSTVDAYELTLAVSDPQSSDKTITFPDITGTLITTADTNTVTSTMVDASLVNANLAAGAAIAFSKLAALPSAQIIVGNGSTVPTAVAVTGDISINNAGLTAIATGVIVNSDISGSAAITGSKVTTGTTSAVGVLQLTDSTSSTSATTAATPNAVKTVNDALTTTTATANAALPKAGGTMTGNLIVDNAKEVRFSEADSNGANYLALKAPASVASDITWILPATDSTGTQFLKSDGSGNLGWASDNTTDNTKLPLTGGTLTGDLTLNAQKDLRFADSDSSHYIALQSPGTIASSFTLTLPATDAAVSGYVLASDGSGTLSWVDPGSSSSPTFTGDATLTNDGALVGFSNLNATYTGNTKTLTVTVASKTGAHRYNGSGSSSGYKIGGKESPFLTLTPGRTYKFDQADNSNSGHPLRFYLEANKTTAYTTGVTTNGTAGSAGAYTQIVVSDTTPQILHYQCSAHSLMGNAVQTNSNQADLSTLNASNLSSGTVNVARLGSGSSVTTKFLRGDNTWQTISATPEGTAILSTGESGGTKFLREDGDGTCSWQTAITSPAGSDREFQINNNGSFGSTSTMKISGDDIYFYGASKSIYWDKSASALQFAYGGPLNLGNNAYIRADYNGGSGAEKLVIVGETAGTDITGNVSISGTATATTFSGSGASLTSLNASNISSGTIAAARIPTLNQNTTGTAGGILADADITLDGDTTISGPLLVQNSGANQNTSFHVKGTSSSNARIFMSADNADDNADKWRVSATTGGAFTIEGYASGSWSTAFSLSAIGNLTVNGGFLGSGASLTYLNASNLASGTVPDARFPSTLPAVSGANLTSLNASNLGSGTIPDARFPSTLPAVSGANLTNLPASGGVFTATASGSITAGKPVIVKTNGQVEQIVRTVTHKSPPDTETLGTTNRWYPYNYNSGERNNGSQGHTRAIWVEEYQKLVCVWEKYRSGQTSSYNKSYINSATISDADGTATWDLNGGTGTTDTTTIGNPGTWNRRPFVAYDSTADRIVVAYGRGNYREPYTVVLTPDWTGGTWPSSGGNEQGSSIGNYPIIGFSHDKQHNKFVMYYRGSSDYLYCKVGEMNANKNGITWGSAVQLSNFTVGYFAWIWHPRDGSNGRHYCFIGDNNASGYPLKYVVHSVSSSSNTTTVQNSTSGSTIYSSGYHHVDGGKGSSADGWTDGTNYKIALTSGQQQNGEQQRLIIGTANTTSISFGSSIQSFTQSSSQGVNSDYYYSTQLHGCYWDSISEKLVTYKHRRHTSQGSAWWFDYQMWSISGNTPSKFNNNAEKYSHGNSGPSANIGNAVYIQSKNWAINVGRYVDSSNNVFMAHSINTSSFTTNLTANNFAGFSTGSYSNGNTATITHMGGINTNQSSLAPASKYYVIDNGTISTTAGSPSVEAGLALAATKLLVKG